MTDHDWMRHALTLAARGQGAVEPNPMVGAVVVREGRSVGEGWHQRFGGPHAEIHALAAAGEAARGATLYVTLEPCCHHGKTPPCTDAVLAARPARVVIAQPDPFPKVAGRGIELLRAAGIEVVVGIEEHLARQLNAPYLTLLAHQRPWVIAKWAMTLDGRIATRTGDSRWISNETARRVVHQIRGRVDAILVGIGTALADDPLLNARPPGPRRATRIVLDSTARLPPTSQLVQSARDWPTLVVVTPQAPPDRCSALTALGCEVLSLDPGPDHRPSIPRLLLELGRRRFTNLLLEGGGEILGSFRDADRIDEVQVFLAPSLMGGADARAPVLGRGAERIADLLPLGDLRCDLLDGNLHLQARRPLATEQTP